MAKIYDTIVIGAGFGGIGMGWQLANAGSRDFLILERKSDLGGIWRDNTYPNVSCDVPGRVYGFSFYPNRSVVHYPKGDHTQQYIRDLADSRHLTAHLRCNTEVTSLTWDDHGSYWSIGTKTGTAYAARFVVAAVGQLHWPKGAAIEGKDTFRGSLFHTADWDHSVELRGKNIAIIGTGPSTAQLLPALIHDEQAARIEVFQRTANWVLPIKGGERFSPPVEWLFKRQPRLYDAYGWAVAQGADYVLGAIGRQGWSARPAEWWARAYLRQQIKDPQLRSKLTPTIPLGCKRIIVGKDYLQSFTNDTVTLVTDPITRIVPDGIEVDGRVHRADIIVEATGFHTTEFLKGITVTGPRGLSLAEAWRDGPTTYLGAAIEGFYDLGLIHSTGSFNPAGSNVFMAECQIGLHMNRIALRRHCSAPTDLRPGVMSAYTAQFDAAMDRTVFGQCDSWYTMNGRPVNVWPGSAREFRRKTQAAILDFTPVVE